MVIGYINIVVLCLLFVCVIVCMNVYNIKGIVYIYIFFLLFKFNIGYDEYFCGYINNFIFHVFMLLF